MYQKDDCGEQKHICDLQWWNVSFYVVLYLLEVLLPYFYLIFTGSLRPIVHVSDKVFLYGPTS